MTTKARPQCKRQFEPSDIWKIRDLHKWGYSQLAISLMFSAATSTIHKIVNYSTYKDIL